MSYGQSLDANPFADSNNAFGQQSNASAFSLESTGPSGGVENIQSYVADHDRRARELEQKQRELEQRERDLQQRENEAAQYRANWPPFVPLVVHKIDFVPTEHQKHAKLLYYYWLQLVLTLVLNFVGCLALMISGQGGVAGLGASAGFLGFITIFSFILWYYPVYNGWRRVNKRGAAILFYTYFIFCGCHLIWCLYMVIGAPSTGSDGLYNTIASFINGHIFPGIVGVFVSIGWIMQLVGGMVLWKLVWNFKRNNADINFANAKAEFNGLGVLFKLFRRTQTASNV